MNLCMKIIHKMFVVVDVVKDIFSKCDINLERGQFIFWNSNELIIGKISLLHISKPNRKFIFAKTEKTLIEFKYARSNKSKTSFLAYSSNKINAFSPETPKSTLNRVTKTSGRLIDFWSLIYFSRASGRADGT